MFALIDSLKKKYTSPENILTAIASSFFLNKVHRKQLIGIFTSKFAMPFSPC